MADRQPSFGAGGKACDALRIPTFGGSESGMTVKPRTRFEQTC